MALRTSIDPNEFQLMRDYIEKSCGIHLTDDKMYLVETRLTTLMIENGCMTFTEFYQKAKNDVTNAMRDKMVDAMTTNETLWFRDKGPFQIFEEAILRKMCEEIQQGKRTKIRIWCAACSTGQEPYSIAMTILNVIRLFPQVKPGNFAIVGTDISPTVLYLAMAARYDHLAISRGLPPEYKDRYFNAQGKVWALKDEVKAMVTFKKFNLQDDFTFLGKQDIVFCRNVLIYFSDTFKKVILSRIAKMVQPDGYLFLGASESLINYTQEYEMLRHAKGLYYRVKPQ